jgi:hypothetical protein
MAVTAKFKSSRMCLEVSEDVHYRTERLRPLAVEEGKKILA